MRLFNQKALAACCALLLLLAAVLSTGSTAATPDSQEIDISTDAGKVLFDLGNIKPGDWAERDITLMNTGRQDSTYITSVELESGSQKLYDNLVLKVYGKGGKVFEGTLGEFKKLNPRMVKSREAENLILKMEMPWELGNEYQGLGCNVAIKFNVEGTMGGMLPQDGMKLPNTATGIFNMLAAGILFSLGGGAMYLYYLRRKKQAISLL
ncbi:LPXTG cell wall anchor domain-containing protein [Bacillus massilinigeriensis]|uniref:LPXTG cell wall anchor domain-containing protein n=1 Tax=Bacillus mediterraneensis TaxID=1805474 RepID=UPI0008F8B9F0|nr:LPXTG cell wall anchor domain-containing protein [Bacillus mediterraneensis]